VALILTALFLLVFATAAGAGYDLSHWMLAVKQARHEAEFEAVSAVMEPGRADGSEENGAGEDVEGSAWKRLV